MDSGQTDENETVTEEAETEVKPESADVSES